jgi:hypothetical protein
MAGTGRDIIFEVKIDHFFLQEIDISFIFSRGACCRRIDDVFERWFEEVQDKTRGGASKFQVCPLHPSHPSHPSHPEPSALNPRPHSLTCQLRRLLKAKGRLRSGSF